MFFLMGQLRQAKVGLLEGLKTLAAQAYVRLFQQSAIKDQMRRRRCVATVAMAPSPGG